VGRVPFLTFHFPVHELCPCCSYRRLVATFVGPAQIWRDVRYQGPASALGIVRARIVSGLKPNRLGLTRHCENLKGKSAIGARPHRHRKFWVAQLGCSAQIGAGYCSAVARRATQKKRYERDEVAKTGFDLAVARLDRQHRGLVIRCTVPVRRRVWSRFCGYRCRPSSAPSGLLSTP
jgi:hypothetical protein